jgi:phosphate transport system substrate-binding protein
MLSSKRIAILAGSLLLIAALVAGCGQSGLSGTVTAAGSTAIQPLADEAAKQFTAKNPKLQIVVNGGGSGAGLTQVSSGAVQIGDSDIYANEKSGIDAAALVDHKVAVVGTAAVTNPGVGVANVTQAQLIDIFTGRITYWKQLGGVDQKIIVINRPASSGTRLTFQKYALNGAQEIESQTEDSSGTVRQIVGQTPGAISYLAMSYVDSTIKALSIDGVAPTVENITTGSYKVWAYMHMYTKGEPTGAVKAFLDYMMTDEVQQGIVAKLGYIPAADMKVAR